MNVRRDGFMFPNTRESFEFVLTDGLDELLMQLCYIQDNIRHRDNAIRAGDF